MCRIISLTLSLLALLTITSCGGAKEPVALKNAFPPGTVFKEEWQLNEKASDSTVVKIVKGEEVEPTLTGRFEALYGPANGVINLTVIVRVSSTIERCEAEFKEMRPQFKNPTEIKGLADEAFSAPSSMGGEEIRLRYRNLNVVLLDWRATREENLEYAKRYVEFVEKAQQSSP